MHSAILHRPLTHVNVKMATLEVDFHVSQQTVHRELFNLEKLVFRINVLIVSHDLHVETKMQAHHQQHVNVKKDGLGMVNSVCRRKM